MKTLLKINYIGGDISLSGEKRTIRYLKKRLTEKYVGQNLTLLDVGANIGDYSKELVSVFPNSSIIYAFEPLPSTYKMLTENVKTIPNISCHNVGMSDKKIVMPVYTNHAGSGLTSVYQRRLDHFNVRMDVKENCEFTSVDDFCKDNHIEHIHFLKIDVEGHELSVLRGANEMMKAGRIDYIQFEFGGCNIDSRTFFQDFWYLLKDRYKLYRIIPTGLCPIKEYTEMREIFICSNYLAELNSI